MRSLIAVVITLMAAVPAAAQIQSRPSDPPIVTAENDAWYRLGEPVQFAGDEYYRAGAATFFNGNTMVRTGHYNGVPLYADTTIEPYSVVHVPIGRGLMQPYERLRRGELAGTSGSRLSSFPGGRASAARAPAAAVAPTSPPQPIGAISTFTPEPGAVGTTGVASTPRRMPEQTVSDRAVPDRAMPMVTVRRGQNNDGIWVSYQGQKWVSAGPLVPLSASDFVVSGNYAGVAVYTKRGANDDTIYLPMTPNQVAPYRLRR